jgi:hypothetical protein
MKHLTLSLALILLSLSFSIQAQLKGTLIDQDQQPIEFANVALYSMPDSVMITGAVSDVNGNFTLNTERTDNAFLKISFIGYETQTVTAKQQQTIVMKAEASLLGEVVVSGTRKTFTMENGNILANVSGTVLEKEINVMEVLRKIPGMIEKDGKLTSLAGGTPIIYINGRKLQSMDEVKQLEVKNIKSVTLNTNPGAEYDASTGAVLLITTLRRIEGLSVQVESALRRNHAWSNNQSIKINYNKDKLNLFGNVTYDDDRKKSHQHIVTTIYTPDTTWRNDFEVSTNKTWGKDYTFALGADYAFSEKQSIGVKYDGYISKMYDHAQQPLSLYANGELFTNIDGSSILNDENYNHHVNMYYVNAFSDRLKMELYTDYLTKHGERNQEVSEDSDKYGNIETNTMADSEFNLFAVNPRFNFKLNDQNSFLAGMEYSNVSGENNLNYIEQTFANKQSTTEENKISGYLSYNFRKGGFDLSTGLRYENVKSSFVDKKNSENNIERTYNDFFPNLSLSYQRGTLYQSLNYRSGIQRPGFGQLGNYAYYLNQFQRQEGNPNLIPQISHRMQYSLMYRFLYFSMAYTYIKDCIGINYYTSSPTSSTAIYTWQNFDKAQNVTATLNLQHTFGFYKPSLTLAYIQNFMTVETYKGQNDVSKPIAYILLDNTFQLPADILFNIEYNYTSSGSSSFLVFEPKHIVNARIQKTFLNDNLQVSVSAKDLFRKDFDVYEGSINQINFWQREDQDRRSVSLNLVWRFNNYKKTYKGESAAQDVIDRL